MQIMLDEYALASALNQFLKIAEAKHKYHNELIARHLSWPTDAALQHNIFVIVISIEVNFNKLPNKPTRIIDIFFGHTVWSICINPINTQTSQSRQAEISSLGTYSCRWGRSIHSKWFLQTICRTFDLSFVFSSAMALSPRWLAFFTRTRIKRLSWYIDWMQRPISYTHHYPSVTLSPTPNQPKMNNR